MSTAAAPAATPKPPQSPHIWTGNADQEDRVETLIKKSGCWDLHLKVSDCMGEHRDWRKCQDVVKEFRTCVQSVQVGEPPKEAEEKKQ
ncbi:hypothetical protein L5515_010689 [Caenorhabditis briggsae]|uniref:Uncharacterized protein n=1 Tax=Caenorhabditis briggsae TaxID=6238 RepID=A0AAE9ESS8_CAEBR|nr:hypothetical protein L3Y34_003534 [Caenorhabditis briggsae]UMM27372.1 hypothetical protein L5515_010689 [Caenorhabditis briggsae]